MATKIRLSEAVRMYLEYRQARYSKKTVEHDTYVLRRFSAHTGDLLVSSLNAEHIEAYFSAMLAVHTTRDGVERQPVKPSTFNQMRARLKAFFDWLTQRGHLRADLLVYTTPMRIERRTRQQVSAETVWTMLDSAKDLRDRAILSTAINTGLRSNEISALRIEDVDLGSESLHVRISKSRTEDEMPITEDLARDLQAWLAEYRLIQARTLDRIPHPADFLFPARQGPAFSWRIAETGEKVCEHRDRGVDPLRSVTRLHLIAQDALRAAGLPHHGEGIHTLRRSAARLLFDSLVNERGHDGALRVTSAFLHHSNVSTTEAYLGVTGERRTRDLHLRGRSLLGPRPADATVTAIR